MSLALSRDQDPHTDSRIALVGAADDSVNTALASALEKEQIHVTRMPSEKLTDAQNGLHDKRFQLVLLNPNPASGKIADNKALQIYVPPDTEPSWLAAVKRRFAAALHRNAAGRLFRQQRRHQNRQ